MNGAVSLAINRPVYVDHLAKAESKFKNNLRSIAKTSKGWVATGADKIRKAARRTGRLATKGFTNMVLTAF